MAKKKDENKRVIFRRIGGRLVPITVAAGVGIEASRRRTLSNRGNLKITERRSILSSTTTIRAKKKVNGLFRTNVGIATFSKSTKGRANINLFASSDKKSTASLFVAMNKSAKRQGFKTFTALLANPSLPKVFKARGGKLISTSKSGKKLIGAKAASGEITRFLNKAGRAGIMALMRVR